MQTPVTTSLVARVAIGLVVLSLAAGCAGMTGSSTPPVYRDATTGERIDPFSGQPLIRAGR